jgi:DNA-binding CsgD family transcriptional regulator
MSVQHRSDDDLLASMSRGLWELDCLPSFRTGVLALLREMIGCDIASYNEIGDGPGEVFVVADPLEDMHEHPAFAAFADLVLQNPLAAHTMRTRDPRALRLSDFISRRRLHALELYEYVYRQIEIEHQMAFTVPDAGQLIGITVSRDGRDFDDRELGLLEASRGMVVSAFRSLHDRARLEVVSRALDQAGEGSLCIALVEASGTMRPGHARAEQLLSEISRLPLELSALREWAREQRRGRPPADPTPLIVECGGTRLQARYVHGQPGMLDAITLQPLAVEVRTALRALGLTRRQADVLEMTWRGATNAEVALALCISEHTVRHHLEEIYRRLGVSTRAAATHLVTQTLSTGREPLLP